MIKRCTRCIMPDTKPGITFNKDGVCNACQYTEAKTKIDWPARFQQLLEIANRARVQKPNGYDCVVPVSGGKDSVVAALLARDQLGLTPLLVYGEPCYPTERGRRNLGNLSSLGFDIFVFKPNQKIMPGLLKRSFLEDGQPARAFEFLLYGTPMHIAMNYRVPLVLWGEGGLEYGNAGPDNAMDNKSVPALAGANASHWLSDTVKMRDLVSFQHPTASELSESGVLSVYLSDFIYWDSRRNAKAAIENGLDIRPDWEVWRSGGYWPFEQLDDEVPVISHYLKYMKFGYGRATDQACRDIRWGYIDRYEGLKLAEIYDNEIDSRFIERYAAYIGISIQEFYRVADSFRGDAWKYIDDKWELWLGY